MNLDAMQPAVHDDSVLDDSLSVPGIHLQETLKSFNQFFVDHLNEQDCFGSNETCILYDILAYKNSESSNEFQVNQCNILLDCVWEIINIGHWKNVKLIWRQLYRGICFIKAVLFLQNSEFKQALLSCDMGIIMGAPLRNEKTIQLLADHINNQLVSPCDIETAGVSGLCPYPNLKLKVLKHILVLEYHSPTIQKFLELVKIGKPFIIRNAIDHWPAVNKWSPKYLLQEFGERTVPVEIGSSYTSSSWSQKLMKLKDFINNYVLSESVEVGYLAQYDLFSHFTNLENDISSLDYLAVADAEPVKHCWFGPGGTMSPLHHDRYENLFCQVAGYKRFIMFDRTVDMYPHEHHLLHNTSQVDVESPHIYQKYPGLGEIPAWVAEVGPGDVLYVPLRWWHHVRALAPSFSVSYWWNNDPDFKE